MLSYDYGNARELQAPPTSLVTCSICLRVQHDSGWVPAEDAILELRTFDFSEPVRLAPGLCDDCSDDFVERRGYAPAEADAA
jgi:hypothetical protein